MKFRSYLQPISVAWNGSDTEYTEQAETDEWSSSWNITSVHQSDFAVYVVSVTNTHGVTNIIVELKENGKYKM